MKLNEIINKKIEKQATLAFLVKDKKILLAMKKRGFGMGKWNGVGGKPNQGETIVEAAKREAFEEIGVQISELTEVAKLSFYFKNNPEWSQEVTAFIANKWTGEPTESEEMTPLWYDIDQIPYELMWWDDKEWLPRVLDGKKVKASFLFGDNDVVEDMEIEELE